MERRDGCGAYGGLDHPPIVALVRSAAAINRVGGKCFTFGGTWPMKWK
jgi:hypothetical protein